MLFIRVKNLLFQSYKLSTTLKVALSGLFLYFINMKYYKIAFLLLLITQFSCKEQEKGNNNNVIKTESKTAVQLLTIRFECSNTAVKKSTIPSSKLYAVFGIDDKQEITSTYNCNSISRSYYNANDIPFDTQDAVSSYFNGEGAIYIATIEDGIGKIYKRKKNEKVEKDFKFELIAEYINGVLIKK